LYFSLSLSRSRAHRGLDGWFKGRDMDCCTRRAAAQRRTLDTRISCFREECLEQAGEEIGGASVAAKAIRRSRSRPTKPFEETGLGADPLNQNNGETGKYRCLNQ